ncbi:hypothetical protein C0995_012227 [Termitomyces sp. Mi166|nr:hypothetical protein C0995_012227 [Termitomyces sp. Mi166\
MVDQLMFHQIKGEPAAAAVWKKLTLIHSDKGVIYETDLLTQLQNSCYIENGDVDMHTHLSNLVVLKECLTEINCPLFDASFASYICTSLSLAPSYKPLLITLAANACTTGKSVSIQNLIWHLTKEANNAAIKSSINKHHKVMIMTHAKARGKSKDTRASLSPRLKERISVIVETAKKNGHTNDQCFEEGDGMVDKASEWWVKKHKAKGKDKTKSANAAETEEKSDKNYTFLTYLTIDASNNSAGDNVALAIMSGHSHKAHTASPSASVIIDCSASSHFSASHKKFLNYQEINPESVCATDGCTLSAIGRGDLHICLPMK